MSTGPPVETDQIALGISLGLHRKSKLCSLGIICNAMLFVFKTKIFLSFDMEGLYIDASILSHFDRSTGEPWTADFSFP
jgi:hypothetical protein